MNLRKKPKSSPHKNLCRYSTPLFTGVKLAVQRMGLNFVRYFRVESNEWEEAEREALRERDTILRNLEGKSEKEILKYFRKFRDTKQA